MLKYTIPLTPVTKKNSISIVINRKTGKPFPMQSRQYREYEKKAVWHLHPRLEKPIDTPVNVKMLFYMPTRRRVDLVNLQEAALDILVCAEVLADDNSSIVASMDDSRVLYDKANPRTEIEITEY